MTLIKSGDIAEGKMIKIGDVLIMGTKKELVEKAV